MRLLNTMSLVSLCLCQLHGFVYGQSVANVNINLSHVSEPTWHNYGSTYKDAQGNVQQLNMEVPFFHVVSINTSIFVALDNAGLVLAQLQEKKSNGNTDLMVASAGGNVDAVRQLLAKNAMVNTRNSLGSTALMGAAAGGYNDIVKALIEKGARVNDKNNQGNTALMLAAAKGAKETVGVLLDNKAEIDLSDTAGNTALMYAVNADQSDTAKLLIDKGARTSYQNKQGVTPLALASYKENKKTAIVQGKE